MKSKLKVCLFVTGILIPVILMPVFTGCGQPAPSSPAQANPQPTPVVPTPPPEPEPPPLVADDTPPPPVVEPQPAPEPEPVTEIRRVDVVYFHRTQQCHSCKYAEEHLQMTLEEDYADEMASGLITSQSFNLQDKKNATIVEEYAAYSSQLFITTVKGDEKEIEEVTAFWEFIDDDKGFSELIVNEVNRALESLE